MTVLLPDTLLRLPHREPMAGSRGLSTNCYACVEDNSVMLVDAVFADVLPFLQQLKEEGKRIAGLLITHRHVAAQADALPEILERFPVPVFLHPIDAAHPQSPHWRNFEYQNPIGHSAMREAGLAIDLVPGHTEGHVVIHSPARRFLLTGDCATGAHDSARELTFVRPPLSFNVDDGQLRRFWLEFSLDIDTLGPYHGQPVIEDSAAIRTGLRSLQRQQPTTSL